MTKPSLDILTDFVIQLKEKNITPNDTPIVVSRMMYELLCDDSGIAPDPDVIHKTKSFQYMGYTMMVNYESPWIPLKKTWVKKTVSRMQNQIEIK